VAVLRVLVPQGWYGFGLLELGCRIGWVALKERGCWDGMGFGGRRQCCRFSAVWVLVEGGGVAGFSAVGLQITGVRNRGIPNKIWIVLSSDEQFISTEAFPLFAGLRSGEISRSSNQLY
jgi:hypothetical protein